MKTAFKCVVVGNFTVGKTTLICTYASSLQQLPERFDGFPLTLQTEIGDKTINFTLCDTAGEDADYDRVRPLSYPETDVFLICFSVTSPASYDNVRAKWCPELTHHCPNVPTLLVGTKTDLRSKDDDGETPHIRRELGEQLAAEIGAVKYLECSATTQEGLEHVFHEAIRVALDHHSRASSKTGKCSLC